LATVQQGLEPGKRAAPLCLDYMYKFPDPSFTIQIHVSGHPSCTSLFGLHVQISRSQLYNSNSCFRPPHKKWVRNSLFF
jgi:hypothetical protein